MSKTKSGLFAKDERVRDRADRALGRFERPRIRRGGYNISFLMCDEGSRKEHVLIRVLDR